MFDYEEIDLAKQETLEDSPEKARIAAALMSVHGIRKGVISQEEGLLVIHNILISLLVA